MQSRIVPRASGSGSPLGEDVLARLKAAEEEAARLRAELAAAQAGKDVVEEKTRPVRIDSTDNRETLFSSGQRASWLSEKDVEFFTGSGVGEASSSEPEDPEAKATVQRRLLIGGLLTVGLGAFALVPTEALRPKPPKPMYFYLVSLLRVQSLLDDCKAIVEDADWDQLRQALGRIEGPPNNLRQTLDSIIALTPDAKTATKVQGLASDLYGYVRDLDYNQYFDAIPQRSISGAQNAQYAAFSSGALKAAQGKLTELLAVVPAEDLATARAQLSAGY